MALITCPKCGKKISDRAEKCPQCGITKEEAVLLLKKREEEIRIEAERKAAERERIRKEREEEVRILAAKRAEEARHRAEKRAEWWRKNKKWIITCISLLVVCFASYIIYVNRGIVVVASNKKDISIFRFRKTMHVIIPEGTKEIERDAFSGCSSMTSVTIPNSVASIGIYAFRDCIGLTSVTIPNSVTSIGKYAFRGCCGLTSVTINSNKIMSKDYSDDSNIGDIFGSQVTEYIIGDSVTSIGDYTFHRCTGLISVTIPNSVTSIGSSAFDDVPNIVYNGPATGSPWGAKSLNGYVGGYLVYSDESKKTLIACSTSAQGEVIIPNSVTSIGSSAFFSHKGLTSVTIPNSVTSIGDRAFGWCSGLTSVTIPNSVTSIGDYAFWDCTGLTSLTIPNSVTSIGSRAFDDCSGLTSVTIGNSVTNIGEMAFCDCTNLTSVTIPNSVTSIGESAFQGCSGLTSVTIPNSVTSIGKYAFWGCNNLHIRLPERFRNIDVGQSYCRSVTYY